MERREVIWSPGLVQIISNLSNWVKWAWGLLVGVRLNRVLKRKQGLGMCWSIRIIPFRELKQPIDSSTQRPPRCWRSTVFRPKKRTSNFGLTWNKVGTYKRTASLNDSRRSKSTARGIRRNSQSQPKSATTCSSGLSFHLSTRCSSAKVRGNYQSSMSTSHVIQ